MLYVLDESEIELMRQLMRIVLNEQFRSVQAAKIVYDISLRKQKQSYFNFMSDLRENGIIKCQVIDSFVEIFARLSITLALQYVRNDEIHRRPGYDSILMDLFELILNSLKRFSQNARENAFSLRKNTIEKRRKILFLISVLIHHFIFFSVAKNIRR